MIHDNLSIDDPTSDYLWSLANYSGMTESVWQLLTLIPESDKARIIRLGVWITPTPPVPILPIGDPRSIGLAYCGFRDTHGSMINHVISCWGTETHRYGQSPMVIVGKPYLDRPKEFRIESNDFFSRMEYCEGGFAMRLVHPEWRQWCLPVWGAYDSIQPGGYHSQACLGAYNTPVSTMSTTEIVISQINLGQKRALRKIAQRITLNLGAGSTFRLFWSENGGDFYEFFAVTGANTSTVYPGLEPSAPLNVQYIQVKMSSPNGNVAAAALYKLWAWG